MHTPIDSKLRRPLGLAAAIALLLQGYTAPASAQETDTEVAQAPIEEVIVTGSAIRRIRGEKSLPVLTIDSEMIQKTGASSVTDLLQKLPVAQGGTSEAETVGASNYGFAGISIHDLGENRTLVLLNGRRLAQFGGQTLTGFAAAIDLNSIPVSSIDRIEILTDGASALYGSDAIGGVVNFITKRKTTEGSLNASYFSPQGGAKESNISFSKGFGDFDTDGYNLFVAGSRDFRTELQSTDRDFAKTGIVDFTYNGQRQRLLGSISASGIPANVIATNGAHTDELVSPYLMVNGSCPENHVQLDLTCYYDTVTQIQLYPKRERYTGSASFSLKLDDANTFFTDVLVSSTKTLSKIAPVPGSIGISADSPLFDTYLAGIEDENGDAMFTDDTAAFYRVFDLGPRISDDKSMFYQISAGTEGIIKGWDYTLAISQSQSNVKGNIENYPGYLALNNLLDAGIINPFVGPDQQTAEGKAALESINYRGFFDGGVSRLQTAEFRTSHSLFEMPSGKTAMFAAGGNTYRERFRSKQSGFSQGNLEDPVTGTPTVGGPGTGDLRFDTPYAVSPYQASRTVWGTFLEVMVPVIEPLEVTGAIRHDQYSDFGGTTNYKGSFRFTPTRGLLFRGSYGTGFKAPTVPQTKTPLQNYGVTGDSYDCTPELQAIATSLGAACRPPNSQYDYLASGNPDLKPEESRQATVGFVFEPTRRISFSADYWWTTIKNVQSQIPEAEAFANANLYPNSWTTFTEPATGNTYVAFYAPNVNTGRTYVSGIDFNSQLNWSTPIGRLESQLIATYLLTDKQQTLDDGPFYSTLADYSEELDLVAFRWKGRLINTLTQGNWRHTVTVNYSSGYNDKSTTAYDVEDDGTLTADFDETDVQLKVKQYFTFDWQTTWTPIKSLDVTVGALNLFDKDPPLSLTEYNFPIGYDSRYYDPRGRILFGKLAYHF